MGFLRRKRSLTCRRFREVRLASSHTNWEGAFEKIPRARPFDEFHLPDLAVGLYDWVIAWDHREHRAWVISQGFPAKTPAERERQARQRLEFVRGRLASSPSSPAPFSTAPRPASARAPQFPAPGLEHLTSNFSRDAYIRAVERTIEWIFAGDIFQANLSQRLLYPARLGPIPLARRLRQCNPAPFGGVFLSNT